jgi:hypothetical protein
MVCRLGFDGRLTPVSVAVAPGRVPILPVNTGRRTGVNGFLDALFAGAVGIEYLGDPGSIHAENGGDRVGIEITTDAGSLVDK